MSSRPMAWGETDADWICHLQCFGCTNGKIINLVKIQGRKP